MASFKIVSVVIGVTIFTALIPTIATSVTDANLTGATGTLLGLTTLVLVAGFIYGVYRTSGMK